MRKMVLAAMLIVEKIFKQLMSLWRESRKECKYMFIYVQIHKMDTYIHIHIHSDRRMNKCGTFTQWNNVEDRKCTNQLNAMTWKNPEHIMFSENSKTQKPLKIWNNFYRIQK